MRSIPTILAIACLSAASATAQSRWFARHRLKLELLPPALLAELDAAGRMARFGPVALHDAIETELEVLAGSSGGLGVGVAGGRQRKLPSSGLWNVTLWAGGKRRPYRFLLGRRPDGYVIVNQTGAMLRLRGYEIAFLDLDHDGGFGGPADGYAVRPPRSRSWQRLGGTVVRKLDEALTIDDADVWFEVDPIGATATGTDRAPARPGDASDLEAALAAVNAARGQLGFEPVTVDPRLSRGCERHARYCVARGQLTHVEELGLRGYTESGERAGRNSVLCRTVTLRGAVDIWLASFYHRVEMLSPRLSKVGLGFEAGIGVMDVLSAKDPDVTFAPYAWPPDGATDVALGWPSGENPSPIGDVEFTADIAKGYGYPITLTFPSPAVGAVEARLLEDGRTDVPVFVSTPASPSNPAMPDNKNSILIMAKRPLKPDTTYAVSIRCSYRGRRFRRDWTFNSRKS